MKYEQADIVRKLELLREQYRRDCEESVGMAQADRADWYNKGRSDATAMAICLLDNVLDDLRMAE